MKRRACICDFCARTCSLRSERVLYCDTFQGRNGQRLARRRKTDHHLVNPPRPQDVGWDKFEAQ